MALLSETASLRDLDVLFALTRALIVESRYCAAAISSGSEAESLACRPSRFFVIAELLGISCFGMPLERPLRYGDTFRLKTKIAETPGNKFLVPVHVAIS
jgi:hypothetical protein